MTGPPTPSGPLGPDSVPDMAPERESRVLTYDGIDGQYDHRITDAEWDAANDYASRAVAADSFPCATSIEDYRSRLLCALAFQAYCEATLESDAWSWRRPITEADISSSEGWNTEVFLDPLRFTVHGQPTVVGPVAECPLPSVIDPLVQMVKLQVDDDMPTVAARLDPDENHVTVYGLIGREEHHTALREMIDSAEDIVTTVHEWKTELEFGDAFPPHMLPLGAIASQ